MDRVVTADEAVVALGAMAARVRAAKPQGRYRVGPTTELYSTDIPIAIFNSVFAPRAGQVEVDPDEVAAGLDELAANGLPYSLVCRPSARAVLEPLADARSLTLAEQMPVMVLDDLSGLDRSDPPAGLEIRRARADDYDAYIRAAAEVFEATDDQARQVIPVERLADEAQRYWLGSTGDGALVATAVVIDDWVGVFTVGTPAELRRRGYGRAITTHALLDARASGARRAVLTASQLGFGVYSAMGFRVVERQPMWTSD